MIHSIAHTTAAGSSLHPTPPCAAAARCWAPVDLVSCRPHLQRDRRPQRPAVPTAAAAPAAALALMLRAAPVFEPAALRQQLRRAGCGPGRPGSCRHRPARATSRADAAASVAQRPAVQAAMHAGAHRCRWGRPAAVPVGPKAGRGLHPGQPCWELARARGRGSGRPEVVGEEGAE
jgi:hypothetical protein